MVSTSRSFDFQSISMQAAPEQNQLSGPQQGLLILGQLLAALGSAAPAPLQQSPSQPQQQQPNAYAAAFKPTSMSEQQFSTVPQ